MRIEVLGPGCPKCHQTEKNVKLALDKLGVEAAVEHVEDMREIVRRGVMLTPALSLDGEVVTSGHVPTTEEVVELIKGRAH